MPFNVPFDVSPCFSSSFRRFSSIAGDLPAFRQLFCKGLCSALGLPAHGNCVEVLNVSSGSIVVEFLLRPRAHTDSRSAFELSQLLEKQLCSAYSALRRGPLGLPQGERADVLCAKMCDV